MLNDDHDVCGAAHLSCTGLGLHKNKRYYAEVPAPGIDEQSRLIEQVIHLAFDTLGVRHLACDGTQ